MNVSTLRAILQTIEKEYAAGALSPRIFSCAPVKKRDGIYFRVAWRYAGQNYEYLHKEVEPPTFGRRLEPKDHQR